MPANSDLYSTLIANSTLSDADRHSLKVNRGFTDQTIDTLKFKSSGEQFFGLINALRLTYDFQALFDSGLIKNNKDPIPQLCDPGRIVIPFFGTNEIVTHLTAHKSGNLPGIGVAPYSDLLLQSLPDVQNKQDPNLVILCESPFKAAALWQLGFHAIGLCGVSTFVGRHLDELIAKVERFGKIFVCFDNEIQDDESLPSYKDLFRKRYAHLIWAYILAKKLDLRMNAIEGMPKKLIRIMTLPRKWMVNGKIDCDTALAYGRTAEDFQMVMGDSVDANTYRKTMDIDPKHRSWVLRQIEIAHHHVRFFEENNKYYVDVEGTKAKPAYRKELSNFKIKLGNIIDKGGEMFREVQLRNYYDDVSEKIILSADEMSSFKAFKSRCMGRGDFIWKGTDTDFDNVIEFLFMENQNLPIKVLDMVGRDDEHEQWVFKNMILRDNGVVIEPEEDGLTFEDVTESYRIMPLTQHSIPSLSTEPLDIFEVLEKFEQGWGTPGVVAFAYAMAGLFSNAVYDQFQAFPFGLLYGEKEAGKSTLSDAMVGLLGFPKEMASMNISDTTPVAIGRKLAYYSSIPCRFDEFRLEDKKTREKQSFFRSLYNRQVASKGIKDPFGVREVRVVGTCIIIGEERPDDPALMSRMIPMYVKGQKTEHSYEAVQWLYQRHAKLSYCAYSLIKDYAKTRKQFMADLIETRGGLASTEKVSPSFRAQFHYAILMAVMGTMFPDERVKLVQEKLMNAFKATTEDQKRETSLTRFFESLILMRNMKEPVMQFFALNRVDNDIGYMYFTGLHSLWMAYKQKHGEFGGITSEKTLKQYMMNQPYVRGITTKQRVPMLDGKFAYCCTVRLKHEGLPDSLRDLFEEANVYDKGAYFDESDAEDKQSLRRE